MVSGVNSLKGRPKQIRQTQLRQCHIDRLIQNYTHTAKQKTIASEQINLNKVIIQAVAEATRVAIQTMVMASTPSQNNTGLKMSGSIMNQPIFNCNTKDNYEEL